jgi:hypothetical protein
MHSKIDAEGIKLFFHTNLNLKPKTKNHHHHLFLNPL